MWCIPYLTEEFISRMEVILDLYALEYNPKRPVLCLDEKPVQLLGEKRNFIPCGIKKILKRDYEYKRCGTANVFCVVEAKAGKHYTYVTENKKRPEFAKLLYRLSKKYSDAETIELIMDNYSTHTKKSLTDFYGKEKGEKIWSKFTVNYTPTHASWLDQAEIEINLYSTQCLGKRRISSITELRKISNAWNKEANRKKIKINWQFTTAKAREKFKYNKLEIIR